jgi:prevent-host-death family protein
MDSSRRVSAAAADALPDGPYALLRPWTSLASVQMLLCPLARICSWRHDIIMPKETVTQVSSADFAKNPQHYLAEVAAGRLVEITAPGEAFVILSKEDFEGHKATVEPLSHPENAKL